VYDAGSAVTGAPITGVDYPGGQRGAFLDEGVPRVQNLYASLLQDQADGTGLLYRRNRYYDPQTGRFTQEDPVGLAGGLNLYGYAGGDPVNYSDPFGLCVAVVDCPITIGTGTLIAAGVLTAVTVAALVDGEGFADALDAGADAVGDAFGAVLAFGKNRQLGKGLRGDAAQVDIHFAKLSTPGQPGGDDPNTRNKWKKDIQNHINEMKKQIDRLKGDRNKQPWEEKVKQYEEQLRQIP
jgi:RHS repeat-associated protein